MKKLWILLCIFTVFAAGCGRSGTQVEGTLPELMEKVYAGTDGDMPELVQTEVTGDRGTGLRADDQRHCSFSCAVEA